MHNPRMSPVICWANTLDKKKITIATMASAEFQYFLEQFIAALPSNLRPANLATLYLLLASGNFVVHFVGDSGISRAHPYFVIFLMRPVFLVIGCEDRMKILP